MRQTSRSMASRTIICSSVKLWALIRPGIKAGQRGKIHCRVPHPLERGFYRQLYDGTHTLRENYQAHVFLSARIDAQLIQNYPEHFHAVSFTYEQRLGEIEQQIAALT